MYYLYSPFFGFMPFFWLICLFGIFDVILKGIALWKAGRNNQPYWFVALLVINSIGILPAIYLLFFQKQNQENVPVATKKLKTTSRRK